MVSQSSGRQDSPVDPWEGVSDDPGNTDGLPSLRDTEHPSCPSDIRFTRHRAAWINPPCAQQQLQDASPQVPAVGNRESHTASNTKSPLGTSPLSLGDSVVEASLPKGTTDSVGSSSARGTAGNGSDSSVTLKEERAGLPRRCPHTSLITSSKTVSGPPCPEDGRAFFKPSQLTASADTGNSSLDFHPSCLISHLLLLGAEAECSSWGKGYRFSRMLTSQGTSSVHIVFSPATGRVTTDGVKNCLSPETAGELSQ